MHIEPTQLIPSSLTIPSTESSWSPRFSPPCLSATPPGITLDIYIGEFCSLPPITLKPRPSSVFGNTTTRGWAWPSLAANAATVAYKRQHKSFILQIRNNTCRLSIYVTIKTDKRRKLYSHCSL